MNRSTRAAVARVVLVCQGCRYAFEPVNDPTATDPYVLAEGCPECGDWLFVGELADPLPVPRPRRADR